ncbi:MAG: metallophosphoesterase [Candidatus Thorarchaeota archaeon]
MEEVKLRIAATSDIHWPQYQGLFIRALQQLPSNLDLFLIAGDLVNRGNPTGIVPLVQKLVDAKLRCPAIACFGNDDYDSIKDTLRSAAKDIILFLDDEPISVVIRGKPVVIIGSRGVLDQPTFWQSRNIEGIRESYAQRLNKLDRLLTEAKTQTPFTILLTHYTPTFSTLKGETQRAYAQMGSIRVEELLKRHTPMLAIHGHAHRGLRKVKFGKTKVYNVALPLNRQIVIIKMPP